MIEMINYDGFVVPKGLSKINNNGEVVGIKTCGDCSCNSTRMKETCEKGNCPVAHVFEEYAKISGQIDGKTEGGKMNNMLNGMFGKVEPGMFRLSMNGGIAVKTSNGYKSYNMKSERLTNCNSFVFNVGEEYFFVIPTNKVKKGDIILVSGNPRCVIGVEENKLIVINYEDSTIENILPERHIFMGNTYFYGKIVSMFGNNMIKDRKNTNKILQYMMMSEMMKGNGLGNTETNINTLLPFVMMNENMNNMFDGMFEFEENEEEEELEFLE